MVRAPRLAFLGLLLYAGAVGAGFVALAEYGARPGANHAAPAAWPTGVPLARAEGMPTLMLFLHPRCPCSHATVSELARLMPHADPGVRIAAIFYHPADEPAAWARSTLWDRAAAIPGVDVRTDADGRLAARFGAATSGHAVLYDAAGRLAFHGGLTAARGHEGDNDATRTLRALLGGSRPADALRTHPVYGCALHAPGSPCDSGLCPTRPTD